MWQKIFNILLLLCWLTLMYLAAILFSYDILGIDNVYTENNINFLCLISGWGVYLFNEEDKNKYKKGTFLKKDGKLNYLKIIFPFFVFAFFLAFQVTKY